MADSELLYEVKDRIATITLNRPDKMNAFTGPMIERWAASLQEAQHDSERERGDRDRRGQGLLLGRRRGPHGQRRSDPARQQERPLGAHPQRAAGRSRRWTSR